MEAGIMTTLQIPCNRCGQINAVDYVPSEYVTERFVRACFRCPTCVSKLDPNKRPKLHEKRREILEKLIPKVQASLPYKD